MTSAVLSMQNCDQDMSSDKESASWQRYGNEKLYLATMQLELIATACPAVSAERIASDAAGDDFQARARNISCFWAAFNFIYSAFEGLLCEVAEANQKRVVVKSLVSLAQLLGDDCADVVRLKELAAQTNSWLFILLSLKHTYDSPVARVIYSDPQVTDITDINYAEQEKKHYTNAIIATSVPAGPMFVTPAERRWNAAELTPDLLASVVKGLKSYTKDIRASAVEW